MSPLRLLKDRRRRKVAEQPFPMDWADLMWSRIPICRRVPAATRDELQEHIKIFLDEKKFEGCEGLEITDEIRLTIAANACVLLLHRKTDYFPQMTTIFVYPTEFYVEVEEYTDGVVNEFVEDRSGESWGRGPVVVSWKDVVLESTPDRPYNVVVHEFAHQLDMESGVADGAPTLETDDQREEWVRVFTSAFTQLTNRVFGRERGRSIIDPYAAEDPAEFFAVAVECFFESPNRLRDEVPRVYGLLSTYFQQDPAAW